MFTSVDTKALIHTGRQRYSVDNDVIMNMGICRKCTINSYAIIIPYHIVCADIIGHITQGDAGTISCWFSRIRIKNPLRRQILPLKTPAIGTGEAPV